MCLLFPSIAEGACYSHFQEKYRMNGIQPGYETVVANESHVLSDQGITSELRLQADITNDITYVCDVSVKGMTACKKTIPILFEGRLLDTMRSQLNGFALMTNIHPRYSVWSFAHAISNILASHLYICYFVVGSSQHAVARSIDAQ